MLTALGKAVLKHAQSKRFATTDAINCAKRLDCGRFIAALECALHPLQCYPKTSSRLEKISPERGQLCPRETNFGEETRGHGCPRPFGCGFAALCSLRLIAIACMVLPPNKTAGRNQFIRRSQRDIGVFQRL
jgi:hypothetical protein